MRMRRPLGYGFLAVAVLLLLGLGVRDLRFRGGLFTYTSPPLPEPQAVEIRPLWPWFGTLLRGIFLGFTALAVLGLIVATLDRRMRRWALRRLLILGALALALYLILGQLEPLPQQEEPPPVSGEPIRPADTMPPQAGDTLPPAPLEGEGLPTWALVSASMGIFVVTSLLAFLFLPKGRRKAGEIPVERELGRIAGQARRELEEGYGLEEVVIRCWARMVELLSPRVGGRGDAPALTPRELAIRFRAWGFDHWAIPELTRLFEEVRYGNKRDPFRRERALRALRALEGAYGERTH